MIFHPAALVGPVLAAAAAASAAQAVLPRSPSALLPSALPASRPAPAPATAPASPPAELPAKPAAAVTAPLPFESGSAQGIARLLQQQQPKQVYAWLDAQLSSIAGRPDAYSSAAERQAFAASASQKLASLGPIAMRGSCLHEYDADAQHMSVTIFGSPIHPLSSAHRFGESRFVREVGLQYELLKKDVYVGQNAYGAASEVVRTQEIGYAIAVPRGEDYEPVASWVSIKGSVHQHYLESRGSYRTGFAMTSADARRNDKLIGCLFVIRPIEPYLLEYTSREEPTRERPTDVTVQYRTIVARLESVLVANVQTGQVFVRVDRIR